MKNKGNKINFVDSKKSDFVISKKIEEYLNSDDFYNHLYKIKDILKENDGFVIMSLMDKIIGTIINYYLIFGDKEENIVNDLNIMLDKEIEFILNLDLYKIYYDYDYNYCNKINITGFILNLFFNEIKSKNILISEIFSKKFIFHSFNSYYLQNIKENGLNPNKKQDMIKDKLSLEAIFRKYGISEMFTNYDDLRDYEVCYSRNPFVSYHYSQTSPEWFYHLTGEANVFYGLNKKPKGDAFIYKDYEAAKNNLIYLMEQYKFTNEDKFEFLSIFDDYWKKYDNDYNFLVIIPDKNEQQNDLNNKDVAEELEEYLFNYCNEYTSKKIDVSDAIYVKLPNINTIYKRLRINKKNSIVK